MPYTPEFEGPGREVSPPPPKSAPVLLNIGALACFAFEFGAITFHHRTLLQRSHFGGVCRLYLTPTTGEHHG